MVRRCFLVTLKVSGDEGMKPSYRAAGTGRWMHVGADVSMQTADMTSLRNIGKGQVTASLLGAEFLDAP